MSFMRIGILLTTAIGSAQSQTEPVPATKFEVASIKPNVSGGENMGAFAQPGGRFGARNVPLRFLIRGAYDIKDFQISGGPTWIESDRYDITARAPEGTPNGFEALRPMLQTLLADRFKL